MNRASHPLTFYEATEYDVHDWMKSTRELLFDLFVAGYSAPLSAFGLGFTRRSLETSFGTHGDLGTHPARRFSAAPVLQTPPAEGSAWGCKGDLGRQKAKSLRSRRRVSLFHVF